MSLARLSVAALACAVVLVGCSHPPAPTERTPPFYDRLDVSGRPVDPASSLSMMNQYRGNHGLPPLQWDPTLARIAQAQVDDMARLDRVRSSEEAQLPAAFAAAGVAQASYLANFSAGYRTFAEAFSGWRESKVHEATMLAPRASRIGLATAYAPGSKYKIFWTLVVVEPR